MDTLLVDDEVGVHGVEGRVLVLKDAHKEEK